MTKPKKKAPKKSKKPEIAGVQCPKCDKRLFSWSVHDYKTCGCPNETMVDGGRDYLRYGGMELPEMVIHDHKIDGPVPSFKPRKDSFPY